MQLISCFFKAKRQVILNFLVSKRQRFFRNIFLFFVDYKGSINALMFIKFFILIWQCNLVHLWLFWIIIILFAYVSIPKFIQESIQLIILHLLVFYLSIFGELLPFSLIRSQPSFFEFFQIIPVLTQNRIKVNHSSDLVLPSVLSFIFLAKVYSSLGPFNSIKDLVTTHKKDSILVYFNQVINDLCIFFMIWFFLALQKQTKCLISIMSKLSKLFVLVFLAIEYTLEYFEFFNEIDNNSLPQILKMQLKMLPILSKLPLIIDQMHNKGNSIQQSLLNLVIRCKLIHIISGKVFHEVDEIEQHIFDHKNCQDYVFTHKLLSISVILCTQRLWTEIYLH